MRNLLLTLIGLLLAGAGYAQDENIARWEFTRSPGTAKAGDQIELVFTAQIDRNWYLYSSDLNPELGPVVTQVEFENDGSFECVGAVQPVNPRKKYDKTWDGEITYFEQKAEFRQKIRVLKANPSVRGAIRGQFCSRKDGQCVLFEEPFQFGSR